MSKEYDLGRVVGRDATINGKNAIQIVAGDNIDIQQTDETITISVDEYINKSIKQWARENFSNSNILINGDFQIWQRGTNFAIKAAGYTADRWLNYAINDTNAIISRVSNTSPAPAEYALRIVRNGGTGGFWLTQPIENYASYAGKTLTASFYIRGIEGFAGLITVIIGAASEAVEVTEQWRYITITKENVTFNPEDTSRQGILFVTRSGNLPISDQGIELACVKLELGNEATSFVPRLRGDEEDLCKRYTLRVNSVMTIRGDYVGTNGGSFNFPLVCGMRMTPSFDMDKLEVRQLKGNKVEGFDISILCHSTYLKIDAKKNNHGMDDMVLAVNTGTLFDAEIY